LLPAYRGAAPINWAIYHGETVTGVTVIHMTPRLDAGPAIGIATTPIGHDETAAELEPRLAALGAPLVCQCVDLLAADKAKPIEQDSRLATRAPRLQKSDGEVDWSRSAEQIRNQVRALQPWPKTHTLWFRSPPPGEPLRIILERVRAEPAVDPRAAPGTIVSVAPERLAVATGGGDLVVERLQPAGKRSLSAGEFLNGYPLQVGARWGRNGV
jgi:methionyl-tRNA formyltransferase